MLRSFESSPRGRTLPGERKHFSDLMYLGSAVTSRITARLHSLWASENVQRSNILEIFLLFFIYLFQKRCLMTARVFGQVSQHNIRPETAAPRHLSPRKAGGSSDIILSERCWSENIICRDTNAVQGGRKHWASRHSQVSPGSFTERAKKPLFRMIWGGLTMYTQKYWCTLQ